MSDLTPDRLQPEVNKLRRDLAAALERAVRAEDRLAEATDLLRSCRGLSNVRDWLREQDAYERAENNDD